LKTSLSPPTVWPRAAFSKTATSIPPTGTLVTTAQAPPLLSKPLCHLPCYNQMTLTTANLFLTTVTASGGILVSDTRLDGKHMWLTPFLCLVAGQCLCTNSTCAYKDTAVPTANNKTNGTSGNGSSTDGKPNSAANAMVPVYGVLITSIVAGLTGLLL
jgi:hypothetical protein